MATLTAAANQFGTPQDPNWGAYNQTAAVSAAQQQGYYDNQNYYQGSDYTQGAYNQYYEGTQSKYPHITLQYLHLYVQTYS